MKTRRTGLPTTLYWAYGSNLNVDDMKIRCPEAVPFKPFYLPKGRLVFRTVADVEPIDDEDMLIPGGLWRVTPRCIAALDRYEGVRLDGEPGLYSKQYLVLLVKQEDGTRKPEKCLFYKMERDGINPPPHYYFKRIETGYRHFGLNLNYLYEALNHSHDERDKTEYHHRRWIAKGMPALAKKIKINGRKR